MKKLILLFILITLSFTSYAQQSKISQEVKDYIQSRIDNQLNVGIVLGYIDGDEVEFYSAGTTDLVNKMPVNERSVFEIGSISKVFTTILLAENIKNGSMKLDDPISKYLPNTVTVPTYNNEVITLKDLATHTSSLPRMPDNFTPANPNNPYADYTVEQMYSFLSGVELTRTIGSQYEYSNFAMGLLGHILELHSGKSYEELMIANIAMPLNMRDTKIIFTPEMKNRLAKGHSGLMEVENWDLSSLAGAGGIRSTATDMVKFIQANLSDKSSTLLNAMDFTHNSQFKSEDGINEIGLGWNIERGKFIVHAGATGGYSAIVGFNKAENKGVVVLTNSTENVDAIAIKTMVPSYPLKKILPSINLVLEKEIETNGIEKAIATYKKVKTENLDVYNFDVDQLNTLGYKYMRKGKLPIALEIFKLNVEMFPEESNPYDSLGEAYLENKNEALAILNYKKSLALDPANNNAREVLKGLNSEVKDVEVSTEMLESYVGKYELAPTFHIVISLKEGRLFAQATGQPQVELFPSDYNKFFLKVVDAKVEFNANNKGKIDSMTLFQNGQVLPGKRVE